MLADAAHLSYFNKKHGFIIKPKVHSTEINLIFSVSQYCYLIHIHFESQIMVNASPVILILGAGPNIGQAVARTFALRGYKVALAARSLDEADSTDNRLNITSDFSNSNDVVNAFKRVNKVFGIPSVVIYNGTPWYLRMPLNSY